MERLEFRIVGTLPILMNNPASMDLSDKVKAKATTKNATAQAAAKAYALPSGQLYIPSAAFRRSLVDGGVGRKMGRMTARNTMKASVFPLEDFCALVHPKTGKPITKYEVSTMRAVNPSTKGAVSCSRPLIREWSCIMAVEVDLELVSPRNVLEIWNLGGKIIGVMDFRIEKGGPYGRYYVEPLFDIADYDDEAAPQPKKEQRQPVSRGQLKRGIVDHETTKKLKKGRTKSAV